MRAVALVQLGLVGIGCSIIAGALGSAAAEEGDDARQFWAFKAPLTPAVPEVEMKDWPRGEIDRFILAEIEDAELRPAKEADRHTLARRVYYDLTGLAPSAEQVSAFVADSAPGAYGRLVDGLLADQAFGERMASVWMNIARYAEDQAHQVGEDRKYFYPNAHRYRAWVIAAFNRDLPYDQFIRYQLAADHYGDEGQQNIVALGFLGLGPQYYNRKRLEVMAEEWEDGVDVVTRGFLGLTVACARCHDHKYDPVTMHDYQALAGVFASTKVHKHEILLADGSKGIAHIVKDDGVRDLPLFNRGNVEDQGEQVPRRFLEVLSQGQPLPFTAGSGRRELADAIADPDNPLTARVAVNRLWQMVFGRGLVQTPSNFGKLGSPPTHPELLDYLALRLIEGGWSIKSVVREMVLSSTYRQSSLPADDGVFAADQTNLKWARMERRPLSAEMLRDALLAASGELQEGDSGSESLSVADPANLRRTVYARISRKELDAFLATFDYPDANVHSSLRDRTVTPTQKLFLLNSQFVIARADAIAGAVSGYTPEDGIERIYRQVLSREPREDELRAAVDFIVADGLPDHGRWTRFAHTLLLSNEFLFRD